MQVDPPPGLHDVPAGGLPAGHGGAGAGAGHHPEDSFSDDGFSTMSGGSCGSLRCAVGGWVEEIFKTELVQTHAIEAGRAVRAHVMPEPG